MNKLVALIVSASSLCSATLFANTTTINWGAQTDNGVGTSTGTPLPGGDLVMIGSFVGLSNAQIATASFATLQMDWVQFGQTVIGAPAGADPDGYWTGVSTASASSLGLSGLEVYYWVLNASSFAGATQQGVFTAPAGSPSAASWVFPNDSATPQSLTNDLDQVPPTTGGNGGILIGGFGTGTAFTFPLYNLADIAAVPEPSTYALAALGALGLVLLSRRRPAKR